MTVSRQRPKLGTDRMAVYQSRYAIERSIWPPWFVKRRTSERYGVRLGISAAGRRWFRCGGVETARSGVVVGGASGG